MIDKPQDRVPSTRRDLLGAMAARAAQIGIMFIFQGAALFLGAGRLTWGWAWVFLGIYLASVLVNMLFMLRTNPETIVERGKPKEMRDWDKLVGGMWSFAQFLAIPAVAGLDVRFGWSKALGLAWHLVGAVGLAGGLAIFGWAMITNAYFSTAVRIQRDRGQTICREGPYAFVRHPGYLGAIIQSLAMPLLLGSWWSLIPGVVAATLMAVRTWLEDNTLKAELPGYTGFAEHVRYRLVPGVW